MPKPKLILKLETLEALGNNKYYTINTGITNPREWVYTFKYTKEDNNFNYIEPFKKVFDKSTGFQGLAYYSIKDATPEEIEHLNICIVAGTYIEYIPYIPNELDDLIKQSKKLYNL